MPPKKQVCEEEASLADLCRLLKGQADQLSKQAEQLANISTQVQKVDVIESDIKNIRTLVVSLKEENKELRAMIKQKDSQLDDMQKNINGLETRLNNLEQHHRGWSARVLNIHTTPADEADPPAMIQKVFNLALLPILEGAVRMGKLTSIPSAEQILEVAHVLPGKPGLPKPIIMRFFSRNMRNLIFQLKKDFAEREPDRRAGGGEVSARSRVGAGPEEGSGDGNGRRGRYRYPLYDDLTKANLAKMRAIAQDERVHACWSVNGQIRFKLKNSEAVKRVTSVLEPLDELLK
jgi:hypothetical protein